MTTVPVDQLTPCEIAVMYRARRQVELPFKRWKSLGLAARPAGSSTRRLVQLWSRLPAVVLQHRLLLRGVWGALQASLFKAGRALRRHALLLIAALGRRDALIAVIARPGGLIRKTVRRNKRMNPSTFELLEDPSRLDCSLT